MNIYIKALGFSGMDSRHESKFIKAGIKSSIENGLVLRHEGFNRGVIILRISKMTGLYVYGRYEKNKFIYEYYFPFVVGKAMTDNDELTIERHVDKESFAVVCDEMKTGVTLIFYLQNVMDYMDYIYGLKDFEKGMFNLDGRSIAAKMPIKGKKVSLTALSLGGIILLPISKNSKNLKREKEAEMNRRNLIAAAKDGDEEAMESLTIDDIDTYTQLSHRIIHEDVFTIVDSTFMPCGVECDQYSVIGSILELSEEENIYTGEKIYVMSLECNDLIFTMAINSVDLVGEPAVGRRFKGQIWLQGAVKFKE
jgi:hypothetical protein